MKNTLFTQTYDSESMVDMSRDIYECFDTRFNPNAINLTDDKSLLAIFTFNDEKGEQQLLNRVYDQDTYNDLNEDIHDSLGDIVAENDEHGFFPGELLIELIIQ